MGKFNPTRTDDPNPPRAIYVDPTVGIMIRLNSENLGISMGEFVDQCVRYAIDNMETEETKNVREIIIANDGDKGQLTLIVSSGRDGDEEQNGIEFDIPIQGKDIAISVGECFELEIQTTL